MARLPSLQGKTGNETAALSCTRPSRGTPLCSRPTGTRLRGNRVRIYVRNHLPSAVGKPQSESAAPEKALAQAYHPARYRRSPELGH
jgi:hypothetical protein